MAQKPDLTLPESVQNPTGLPSLMCHRIYAPVVIPEPDPINPKAARVIPRFGNFGCVKDKCSLWNKEKSECFDVTQAKGLALLGEWAFGKLNDVSIDGGGQ